MKSAKRSANPITLITIIPTKTQLSILEKIGKITGKSNIRIIHDIIENHLNAWEKNQQRKNKLEKAMDLDVALSTGMADAIQWLYKYDDQVGGRPIDVMDSDVGLEKVTKALQQKVDLQKNDDEIYVLKLIEKTMGKKNTEKWLHSEIRALGGKKPIDLIKSKKGRKEIIQILGRIEHGVIS